MRVDIAIDAIEFPDIRDVVEEEGQIPCAAYSYYGFRANFCQ